MCCRVRVFECGTWTPVAVAGRFEVKWTVGFELELPVLAWWLVEASRVVFEDLHGQGLEVCEQLA